MGKNKISRESKAEDSMWNAIYIPVKGNTELSWIHYKVKDQNVNTK